uniref:Transcription factor HNF-4 homolog n=1 Tax=Parastrongyloides trichosuri TaxID=131310 RepID=A0A0N4ZN25_PARTI
MSQRRKVPEGTLCLVCADKATGYHYGVASCNGCKTFFRRTIVTSQKFVCQYNGECDINKNVRCACRHCRFNKCIAVGMDVNAIQNDRDKLVGTKKNEIDSPMGNNSAFLILSETCDFSYGNEMFQSPDSSTEVLCSENIAQLEHLEELCNKLRNKMLPDKTTARDILTKNSLLCDVDRLEEEPETYFKKLYPASMNDVRYWNIRELRICLEWVKIFKEFTTLHEHDQFALLHNFSFTFNILNRVYYSLRDDPDKIIYPNGAYILRNPQVAVMIPGCRSIYHRQMDEIMNPLRKLKIDLKEFSSFKYILFFNPNAPDLSNPAKEIVEGTRDVYVKDLYNYMIKKNGIAEGGMRYGKLFLMINSIQQIIAQNDENMQVMDVFGHFWTIDSFVRELTMKQKSGG